MKDHNYFRIDKDSVVRVKCKSVHFLRLYCHYFEAAALRVAVNSKYWPYFSLNDASCSKCSIFKDEGMLPKLNSNKQH